MFLWEDYENKDDDGKEEEKITKLPDSAEVGEIYNKIKKIDGVKNISIFKDYYGSTLDDGRKGISVSIRLESESDVDDVLKKIYSELDSHKIDINSINNNSYVSNGEDKKETNIEIKICKKFGMDRVEMMKKMMTAAPALSTHSMDAPEIKVTSISPSDDTE